MKKLFYHLACWGLCLLTLLGCTSARQPNEIRVLYLGGQSEWSNGRYGSPAKFATDEELQQSIRSRMDAFGDLLRTYFDSVTVMRAADYRPEMSDAYDVTIFDGVPPKLEDAVIERDANGNIVRYQKARYLPDDFSAACITIGSMGETVGRRVGTKNDWYCLCLDAAAHHMNLEHPIFKGPFKTAVTLHKEPTPEDAFHYQYFQDEALPDSVLMWTVNTKGYKTTDAYNPGMVSRPWGYLDSPDCEVISSGVCAKTIDAVAIGRHANFLTWGFIGSPLDMTEEAKVVFANAVAYMAQFKGQHPLARKYNDRIATREYVKELRYLCTRRSYEDRLLSDSVFYAGVQKEIEDARTRLAAGDTTARALLRQYEDFRVPPRQTYADYLKRNQKGLFDRFGENENGYLAYYKENLPYFYGGEGSYVLTVDEDAKAWQIPTNDVRLLDKAITCLEEGMETERANRILTRYTLCEFSTPSEWRAWFDKYKENLFFTESGGWFFLVNDPLAPGNDYSALERRAAKDKTGTESGNGEPVPDKTNPVVISARVSPTSGSRAEVSIHIAILPGFHIYRDVSSSDPYLPLKVEFELPDGCRPTRSVYPPAKPFGSSGTTIYEENLTIRQTLEPISAPASIRCKVSCQACDAHACMPPVEKIFELKLAKTKLN